MSSERDNTMTEEQLAYEAEVEREAEMPLDDFLALIADDLEDHRNRKEGK